MTKIENKDDLVKFVESAPWANGELFVLYMPFTKFDFTVSELKKSKKGNEYYRVDVFTGSFVYRSYQIIVGA